MARAPYQVLVIPFFKDDDQTIRFALFHRSDRDIWHPVAGGGEDNETILETAVRETHEETGADRPAEAFIPLQAKAWIPATEFPEGDWGPDVVEIPEYAFGVEFPSDKIALSDEHTDFVWLEIEQARTLLFWPSNVGALNELYDLLQRK